MPKSSNPHLNRVLRQLGSGYTLEGGGNGHFRLVGPDGQVVRLPNGRPVMCSTSPRSAHNAAREFVRDLRRAGVPVEREAT